MEFGKFFGWNRSSSKDKPPEEKHFELRYRAAKVAAEFDRLREVLKTKTTGADEMQGFVQVGGLLQKIVSLNGVYTSPDEWPVGITVPDEIGFVRKRKGGGVNWTERLVKKIELKSPATFISALEELLKEPG